MTEDITISDTSSDNAEGKNFEQKIACICGIPLSSRRESEKTLKVIDNDVGRVLTFSAYLGSQVFDLRTQDASVAADTSVRISAQGVADGGVHAGQKDVLHLRTTMWISDERNATIQGSTSMVSAPSGLSEQTGPQNQKPSNLANTSKYNACTVCKSSHVRIMLGPFFKPVITLAVGSLHSRRKGNVDQSGVK